MADPTDVVDATAGAGAGLLFRILSAFRRRRFFHPYGLAFNATVSFDGDDEAGYGVPLLDDRAERAAIVRLSRGVGLPNNLPDIRGLALRITDAYGPGRHQDLLLATSGELPVARHLLIPAASYASRIYSTLLPYRLPRGLTLFAARPTTELHYDLLVGAPAGEWEHVARIELKEPLSQAESDALRFNPWNTGGGIEPAGFLQALRRRAYEGSQRGRPDAQAQRD